MRMAESQLAHDQKMDRERLNARVKNERFGVLAAVGIVVCGLVFGGCLMPKRSNIAGLAIVLASVVSLATMLIVKNTRETANHRGIIPETPVSGAQDLSESPQGH